MTYFVVSLDSAEYELWMIWFLYFPKSFDEFLVAEQNKFCGFWYLLRLWKVLKTFENNTF